MAFSPNDGYKFKNLETIRNKLANSYLHKANI